MLANLSGDSAQPPISMSRILSSLSSLLRGKVGRRDRLQGKKGLHPVVEGMDPKLLMAAGLRGTAAQIAARIGPTVRTWMERDHIPGMGVAVTYRGHVLLTKGYGTADLASGRSVTSGTGFEAASITKTFTAEALLLLIQRPGLIKERGIGRVSLDAPIGKYLKDRGPFHLPSTWANLTTRQLLNMSSGVSEVKFSQLPQIPWYDAITASAPNNLEFQPGTQYLYSNVNTWLVGEMISQLSGQTYEQFVTAHLLRPLGMTHTSFMGTEPLQPGQATGYEYVNGQLVQPSTYLSGSMTYASGSIVTTAQDMGKYLAGLQRREILRPAMYRQMWTPTPLPFHSIIGTVTAMPGLGWDDVDSIHVDPKAGRVVTKSGSNYGYVASMSLFLDQGYGISVFCNNRTVIPPAPPFPMAEDIVNAIDAAIVGVARAH